MKKRGQKLAENVIYYLIWLIVFAVTVVGYSEDGSIMWDMVGRFWLRAVPLFLLFLLNNYILIPRLLLRKKYGSYAVIAVVSILLVTAISIMNHRRFGPQNGPPPGTFRMEKEGTLRDITSAGQPDEPDPGTVLWKQYSEGEITRKEFRRSLPPRPFPFKWGPAFGMLLFSLFIVGFNVAIKLIFKTVDDSRLMEQMERQSLQAELDYLKAQVNPHFFMNTLNNIHALVDVDTEKAKETIIELSKIMRYILYETDKTYVSLKAEVRFLRNYVALMRIRYSGNVAIDTVYPEAVPEARIPPLMLITLLENAFKHGISYRMESYIRTKMVIEEGKMVYTVRNSVPEKPSGEKGMGLENLRKRLTLLYGNIFRLDMSEAHGEFTAIMEIPLEI